MRRRTLLLSAAAALTVPGAARAKRLRPDSTRDYGPALLDIYRPVGAQNVPVVFYVHGGAWSVGDRTNVQDKPDFFTGLGMIFVSIDYRTLPEADVVRQRADVAEALAWVRANIGSYGGDADRIVAMGHSAGAHLAALLALADAEGEIAALIANDSGAWDIAEQLQGPESVLGRIVSKAFPDPAQWEDMSPVTHADNAPGMPVMLIWSRARMHESLTRTFASKLKKAHPVTTFNGSAYSHAQVNRLIGSGRAPELDSEIEDFLKKTGMI